MNTWIFGDVHGEVNKLKSCLSQINLQKGDTIIGLGDYVDRGKYSYEVIELLLSLEKEYNCIWLRGNHDQCFFQGLTSGNYILMNQGCKETIESYITALDLSDEIYMENHRWITGFDIESMPLTHYKFFNDLKYYHVDSQNNLFVHGGFNRHFFIEANDEDILLWDRDLLAQARSYESMRDKTHPFKTKNNFKEIFLGHTPVQYFEDFNKPQKYANVNLLDTGCGKGDFPLTIMNLETRQYYQSL